MRHLREPCAQAWSICVVSEPKDIAPIERTGVFEGVYHVLHGALSPLEGIGPDELKISELLRRLSSEEVEEVIIATNPNVEGRQRLPTLPGWSSLWGPRDATCQRTSGGRRPGIR